MAIKVYERYGPRANPADANYPNGSYKNETTPGANDGTPLEVAQANDILGFTDSLLAEAGITANGNPDTSLTSQRLIALHALFDDYGTVEEIKSGKFGVGKKVKITDRDNGIFSINNGGTPDGFGVLDAGNGNTAVIEVAGKVNVKHYGAFGNGVSDDGGAIRSAIRAVIAKSQSMLSPSQGTSPELYFPSGIYNVTSDLSGPDRELDYFIVRGDNAIINCTVDTVDVFGGIGYDNRFYNMQFKGGNRHLIGNNGNSNSTVFTVSDCVFVNPKGSAIDTTDNLAPDRFHSTVTTIKNCKFRCGDVSGAGGTGYAVIADQDTLTIEDSWVQTSNLVAIKHISGTLNWKDSIGVPENNVNGEDGTCWVEHLGGNLYIQNTRLGGEGGGRSWVRTFATIDEIAPRIPSSITIRDVDGFASVGTYTIIFKDMPTNVLIDNANGLVTNNGMLFSDQIPTTSIDKFLSLGTVNISTNNDGVVKIGNDSTNLDAKLVFETKINGGRFIGNQAKSEAIQLSDVVSSQSPSTSWPVTGSGISRANIINARGLNEIKYTAGVAGGERTITQPILDFNLMSNDIYTLSFIVRTVSGEAEVGGTIAGLPFTFGESLPKGTQIINVPFYYRNKTGSALPSSDNITISTKITSDNTELYLGRILVTKGNHLMRNDVIEVNGDNAPTSLLWGKGDKMIKYNPTAGSPCKTCSVAGTPGTWLD